MKISEVVEELNRILQMQGDLDVKFNNYLVLGGISDVNKINVKYVSLDGKYVLIDD